MTKKAKVGVAPAAMDVITGFEIGTVGLMVGGRLQFVFFPSPEGDIVQVDFSFAPGTLLERSEGMIAELAGQREA